MVGWGGRLEASDYAPLDAMADDEAPSAQERTGATRATLADDKGDGQVA